MRNISLLAVVAVGFDGVDVVELDVEVKLYARDEDAEDAAARERPFAPTMYVGETTETLVCMHRVVEEFYPVS